MFVEERGVEAGFDDKPSKSLAQSFDALTDELRGATRIVDAAWPMKKVEEHAELETTAKSG